MIPAKLRHELGLKPGDELVGWLEGDTIVLRRREDIERELWETFAGLPSMTEELLRERRREAKREAREIGRSVAP